MDEETIERALRAVELIPPGRVISYGDLGGLVGVGPRQAGWLMRHYGSGVPWWRVVNASGDLPNFKDGTHFDNDEGARPMWADEGIAWKANNRGCRIADYRADLVKLADDLDAATKDLP